MLLRGALVPIRLDPASVKYTEAYEGSTDENVPWLEVEQQKEKNQTDLQDSLGGIGVVTAGSNPSFDRGHQKRSLDVSHSRFKRKDSDAIRWAHRP